MIIYKHFIGLQRAIENKILLNTIYLISLTFIFFLLLILIIFLKKKNYLPMLLESIYLEYVIWIMPTIIIIILSNYVIKSALYLNPLSTIYNNIKPLILEIISSNWKWIIIYPKQKIILINEVCIPVCVPIKLYLLSNSLMNALCVPRIGIQMYCMTNYRKAIYLLILKHGLIHGITSNYSGVGSCYMRVTIFSVIGKTFYHWVNNIKKLNNSFKLNNYNIISKSGYIIYPKFFNIRNNKIFFLILKFKIIE